MMLIYALGLAFMQWLFTYRNETHLESEQTSSFKPNNLKNFPSHYYFIVETLKTVLMRLEIFNNSKCFNKNTMKDY